MCEEAVAGTLQGIIANHCVSIALGGGCEIRIKGIRGIGFLSLASMRAHAHGGHNTNTHATVGNLSPIEAPNSQLTPALWKEDSVEDSS